MRVAINYNSPVRTSLKAYLSLKTTTAKFKGILLNINTIRFNLSFQDRMEAGKNALGLLDFNCIAKLDRL